MIGTESETMKHSAHMNTDVYRAMALSGSECVVIESANRNVSSLYSGKEYPTRPPPLQPPIALTDEKLD